MTTEVSAHDMEEYRRLEIQNAKRLDRVEERVEASQERTNEQIAELRADIAALPGKLMRDLRSSAVGSVDHTWRWAFGIIVTALGAGFLLLLQNDNNLRSEVGGQVRNMVEMLNEHAGDDHPAVVLSEVREAKARSQMHRDMTDVEFVRMRRNIELLRSEFGSMLDDKEVSLRREIGLHRDVEEAKHKNIEEKSTMAMTTLAKYMETSGEQGRTISENRGRIEEAIKALQREVETIKEEQDRRASRVYSSQNQGYLVPAPDNGGT